ncbi:MAG TPA: prolyl-tRNA synthetase associated domain-containing protein [Alphaproteobacteria bacterium]|nr:prolyl-tRNA synthetase associated domain-containing protein [Alphaproteobacteria bacterium]
MTATPEDLFARLGALGIETTTHEHAPLFTVEESKALRGDLPGGHCKSLFLRDKKRNLWLAVMLEDRAVDMKSLRTLIGASGSLSFGSPELLDELLGVKPGSVTPFALLNDTGQRLSVVLDQEMMGFDPLNYHPLTNTATTAIAPGDLMRFIEACGHTPQILDLAPATRG